MKVLFIGAGVSNHTLRWVNALSERGHEVLLLTRKDQPINDQYSPKVKVIQLKHSGGLGYYLNVPQVRKIFKEFQPDVVNAHYLTGYGTTSRLAKLRPLVLSAWGSDIFSFPTQGPLNKLLLKKNVFYADKIASTSVVMAEEIKKVFPNYKKEITVTPFGIDIEKFKLLEQKNDDKLVIGIVKYLNPIYNIDLLIRAFALLAKKYENIELHIYGDGPLKEELMNLCTELKVEDKVMFLGLIPNAEVPNALNKMDIFVNCSLKESFGVAVLEAMACEKPVVVTDTAGYKEIVSNGVDGYILEDRNPETMANAIEKLINNPVLRKEMGINGRKKVAEKYSWQNNVLIMENLYIEAVEEYKMKNKK